MFTTFLWAWAARPGCPPAPAARSRARCLTEPGHDPAGAGDEPAPLHEAIAGCGWYESSHELHRGIELVEIEWIEAELPAHLAAAVSFA
jgi:hypothetical protein